jgi:hypothetical protein
MSVRKLTTFARNLLARVGIALFIAIFLCYPPTLLSSTRCLTGGSLVWN